MKALFVSLSVLSLALMVGCDSGHSGSGNENTSKVGGPGVAGASDRSGSPLDSVAGLKDNTFELSTPLLATSIKEGEEKSVDIGIERGKGFDQDVPLSFSGKDGAALPKGLTIASATIKKSEKKASIMIKADKEAALGKFEITITGKPSSGPAATKTLKVDVEKNG